MHELSPFGIGLFIAAVAFGFIGMGMSVVEGIAAWRFKPWAFRFGPRILQLRIPLRTPIKALPNVGLVAATAIGRFKVVSSQECLFRCTARWFGQVYTPFPFRGVIRWFGPEADVEVRLPLGGVVFYTAWVIAVTIWCFLVWQDAELGRLAPWILLGSWFFAATICWWSIRYELRRARGILAELDEALEEAAA